MEGIMDFIKKFWGLSWKFSKDVPNLIIGIIVYLCLGFIVGLAIWLATALTGWIPVVGALIAWVLGVVSSLTGVYSLIGLILLILVFCKVIKD